MPQGYNPRRFDLSPLFQVVCNHFEAFRETYHRNYSDGFGPFRHIVTHTINCVVSSSNHRFLACGDPREGIARYEPFDFAQGAVR